MLFLTQRKITYTAFDRGIFCSRVAPAPACA